jgi:hypothetical protein
MSPNYLLAAIHSKFCSVNGINILDASQKADPAGIAAHLKILILRVRGADASIKPGA